ncbi:unnamed protein product [Soboliphyme baturini]|uniref:Uncharacterized protein n=1 Tax=Soboliphyme baturini TaxID=241478 RepID=A0A183IJM2_9BILA|nr:unnamed protein product [Soboliphyme baturini]
MTASALRKATSKLHNSIGVVSVERKEADKPITSEELAMHSPTRPISPERSTCIAKSRSLTDTVCSLPDQDGKLISTAVISGSFSVAPDQSDIADPALIFTAVVSRGASAPDLRVPANFNENSPDLSDMTFAVPPLRSLETLHNQLSLRQVTDFFDHIMTVKTPVPSPPHSLWHRPLSSTSREMTLY